MLSNLCQTCRHRTPEGCTVNWCILVRCDYHANHLPVPDIPATVLVPEPKRPATLTETIQEVWQL